MRTRRSLAGRLFLGVAFLSAVVLVFVQIDVVRADINSGLIGYWKFDENSGTTAADSAGSHPGTLVNGPAWTAGRINSALQFNASDDGNDRNDPRVVIGTSFDV